MNLPHASMKKRSCLLLLSSITTSSWHNVEAFSTISSKGASALGNQLQSQSLTQTQSLLSCNNNNLMRNKSQHDIMSSKWNLSSYRGNGGGGGGGYEGSHVPKKFRKGALIQVEVVKFGPLGASVEIIGHKSHDEDDLIPQGEEPLGYGLILQKEIGYFRSSRRGVDVVLGEILPAYVDWEREDGKVDITLRRPGGKGKAEDLGKIILEALQASDTKEIECGDKSTPNAINDMFPGASKASFKRAVAALYKKKLVQPGPYTTKLM